MDATPSKLCYLCSRIPLEAILEITTLLYRRLNVAYEVAEEASRLIRNAYDKDPLGLCGKKPSVILVAVLYLATERHSYKNDWPHLSQKKIIEALILNGKEGVSPEAMRKRCRQLEDILDIRDASWACFQHRYSGPGRYGKQLPPERPFYMTMKPEDVFMSAEDVVAMAKHPPHIRAIVARYISTGSLKPEGQ